MNNSYWDVLNKMFRHVVGKPNLQCCSTVSWYDKMDGWVHGKNFDLHITLDESGNGSATFHEDRDDKSWAPILRFELGEGDLQRQVTGCLKMLDFLER